MRFTPQQTAQGILTTFWRGDYSLAVSRIRAVPGLEQALVVAHVTSKLTPEERAVLRRYARDLF